MADHSAMKVGRIKPTPDQKRRIVSLEGRLTLPKAPDRFSGSAGISFPMLGNDRYGNCTFAAYVHDLIVRAKLEGRVLTYDEQKVIDAYLAFTGGEDNGCVETDVLSLASTKGIDIGGAEPEKIAVYVSVPVRDVEAIKSLVSIFGALYIGCSLPVTAQYQDVWDVLSTGGDAEPGSWGGHALILTDYDEHGRIGLPTWDMVKPATMGWLETYCDEAYLLLDSAAAQQVGVDWDALLVDVAAAQALS